MDCAPICCRNGPVRAPYGAGAPSRLRRLVISTIIAIALVSHTALTSLHAQANLPIDDWAKTGTVELSRSMSATAGLRSLDLTIREGESATYYLRLSEQPKASGWWVRVLVDGVVYIDGVLEEKGIHWVPSVGWQVNRDGSGATQWRGVTIYATEDNDTDDEFVNVTHEVWDENSNCPPSLHGIAPVTVRIIDNDVPSTSVMLQAQPPSVPEDAGTTQVEVTAALNGAPREQDTDVSVRVVNRTAAAPGRLRAGGPIHDHDTGGADKRDGEVPVLAGGRHVDRGRRVSGNHRQRGGGVGNRGDTDDHRQRHG